MYIELELSMTKTFTVSSRMSIIGSVRLTQTFTVPTLSSTVYVVFTNATTNGSETLHHKAMLVNVANLPSLSSIQIVC